MAADVIGQKRKRDDDDDEKVCGICQKVPEKPMELSCGHVMCREHIMPQKCPTCNAKLKISRFFHENWALIYFVHYFGGYDGMNWTGQRSIYIDEKATTEKTVRVKRVVNGVEEEVEKQVLVYHGPYNAFHRRNEEGVHRHLFDFAVGIEDDSPTIGIIAEIQGMQHLTSDYRKKKDRIKRAWADAFPDRVYLYQIKLWTKIKQGHYEITRKCSITEFRDRVRRSIQDAFAKAAATHAVLPAPEKALFAEKLQELDP